MGQEHGGRCQISVLLGLTCACSSRMSRLFAMILPSSLCYPQVIFVGSHSITLAEWAAIHTDLPSNVYVKRMPKGWNNAKQHRLIIRILGWILQPFMATRQPILSFDAAPLHLQDEILLELEDVGIWYLVIPARLTWMLQPLDTHA